MPVSRRTGVSRPSVPPQTQPSRPAHTQAAPAQHAPPPAHAPHASAPPAMMPPTSSGPGMMGQIAANAASIAVGSVVAQGVSRAIFGGPSGGQQESSIAPQQTQQMQEAPCTSQMNAFAKCMQTNNDNFQACSFYFDMMKQCKASAGQN